jgi:hypothetical protein
MTTTAARFTSHPRGLAGTSRRLATNAERHRNYRALLRHTVLISTLGIAAVQVAALIAG